MSGLVYNPRLQPRDDQPEADTSEAFRLAPEEPQAKAYFSFAAIQRRYLFKFR